MVCPIHRAACTNRAAADARSSRKGIASLPWLQAAAALRACKASHVWLLRICQAVVLSILQPSWGVKASGRLPLLPKVPILGMYLALRHPAIAVRRLRQCVAAGRVAGDGGQGALQARNQAGERITGWRLCGCLSPCMM